MKKTCRDCKTRFDVALEDLEDGDAVACPECNLEYTLIAKEGGKFDLIESKKLEMDDEEFELDEDEDYDD